MSFRPLLARRNRVPLVVGILLVLMAASSSLGAAGARAQEGAPTGAPELTNQWALTPTGDNPEEPSQRTTFTYDLAPGGTLEDSVTVWNYGTEPTGFRLYATDGFTTADGAFDLRRADEPSDEVAPWVSLQQESIIVPPNSGTVIPLTVTIPDDALPGDHAGGIVASVQESNTDMAGNTVIVDRRAAVPLFVRVAGDLHPQLTVEDLSTSYSRSALSLGGGDLEVSYTVHNTGNVRLSSTQKVAVTAPFGFTLADQELEALGELLPGASVAVTAQLSGVAPAFRDTVEVVLQPISAVATVPPPETTRASTSFWAIPWLLVVGLIAVIALAVVVLRRRRSRRLDAAKATTSAAKVTATVGIIVLLAVAASGGLAVVGPLSGGSASAQAPEAVPQTGPDPVISVSPGTVDVGQTIVVTLQGWPAGTAIAGVCSGAVQRGSIDCDQPGERTVEIKADGTGLTRVNVNPPGTCPCVVRVSTPRGDLVEAVPLEVAGRESPTGEAAVPLLPTSSIVPAETPAAAPAASSPFPWIWVLAGGLMGLIALVLLLRRRSRPELPESDDDLGPDDDTSSDLRHVPAPDTEPETAGA